MSKYSDYLKQRKANDLEFFLGQKPTNKTNKYLTFNHVLDEDNIIVCTRNIFFYAKGSEIKAVMMISNNKGVYLQHWQYRESKDRYFDGYMVKLNRKYFKPYTFKNDFKDMCFDKEETFDDLKELALQQNETEYHISCNM